MRRIRGTVAVALAALAPAVGSAGAASTDPVVQLEKSLLKRYPGVAGPLLATSPLKGRELKVIYTLGAVSVWFQRRADRAPACAAARANSAALRDAITGRIMPSADDVRFWASRGVSPVRGVDAFRRGIMRACAIRGG